MDWSAALLVLYVVSAVTQTTASDGQDTTPDIVDLTTSLKTNESMHWPAWTYGYIKATMSKGKDEEYKFWSEANEFKMAVHTGTHMDAPCHMTPNKDVDRLHEVPITRFFGPGAVIDIKTKVDSNREYEMTMDDMREWEDKNGAVPDGAIVLVHTGWFARYNGNLKDYWGTDDLSHPELLSFPGVKSEVAEFLVEERNINALGIDNGSPDGPRQLQSGRGSHLAILGKNRLILENVAPSLAKLPPTGYRIHAVPLNLYDTCGSPIRLLAFKETSGAPDVRATSAGMLVALAVGLLSMF